MGGRSVMFAASSLYTLVYYSCNYSVIVDDVVTRVDRADGVLRNGRNYYFVVLFASSLCILVALWNVIGSKSLRFRRFPIDRHFRWVTMLKATMVSSKLS